MRRLLLLVTLFLATAVPLEAGGQPKPTTGDCVLRDFRFAGGETLPEVRIHYRTFGTPRRDDKGIVRNAVLILHGTGGTGDTFLRPVFAGELFGKDQPLDAARFYLIIPDN